MAIRDSLSKCDSYLYSNPYQIGNHPHLKPDSIQSRSVEKDTIEGFKEEVKKEALDRLRQTTKFLIPQKAFMRIGKYLFLAIALPPYTVMYRIPKWILVQVLPEIIKFTSYWTETVKQKVKKPIEKALVRFNQLMKKIQGTLNGLIQPILKGTFYIKNVMQRIRQTALNFVKRAKIPQPFSINTLRRRLGSLIDRAVHSSQKAIQWIASQMTHQLANLFQPLRLGLSWMKQVPVQFVMKSRQWMDQKRQTFLFNFRTSNQMAQQAAQWISQIVGSGKQLLNRVGKRIKHIYQQKIQPTFQKIQGIIKNQGTSFSRWMNQGYQRVNQFFLRLQGKWQAKMNPHQLSQFFSQSHFSWMPAFMRQRVKSFFQKSSVQKRLYQLFSWIAFLGHYLLQGIIGLFKFIEIALKFLKRSWIIGSQVMKLAFSQVKPLLKNSLSLITRLIGVVCYQALVVVFMLAILMGWSVQWLGELSYFNFKIGFKRSN